MFACTFELPTHLVFECVSSQLVLQFFAVYACDFVDYGGGSVGIFFAGIDGVCSDTMFDTDDGIVQGARSAIIISMICGGVAGVMILFEWLFCEICCAGCLEGFALLGAWMIGGATFMFYGSEFCRDASIPVEELTEEDLTCDYGNASTMLSVACFLYLCCGILLCW